MSDDSSLQTFACKLFSPTALDCLNLQIYILHTTTIVKFQTKAQGPFLAVLDLSSYFQSGTKLSQKLGSAAHINLFL